MNEWTYDPSPSIDKNINEQLTVFPREPDMTFSILRGIGTILLRGFLRIYFRLEISGRENLPRKESFVLIANHSSHLDAVALLAALPLRSIDQTFAVAAKDYFFSSLFRSFLATIFVNALPFDRRLRTRESLELCADVLNASKRALIMFPEGSRSVNGQLQPFKKGLGVLTAGTDRLVVPATIEGAFTAWPKGSVFPKPRKVRVIIGRPLTFKGLPRNENGYLEATLMAQEAVRALGNHDPSTSEVEQGPQPKRRIDHVSEEM